MPRGLVAVARSGGHCPLRVSGGILCSERGQSCDAFQAIPLEETSPRCNKIIFYVQYVITFVFVMINTLYLIESTVCVLQIARMKTRT